MQRIKISLEMIGFLALVSVRLSGQGPAGSVGLPYDWSHRHLVFSQPKTAADAVKIQQNARYWQQVYRRNAAASAISNAPASAAGARQKISRDWSEDLGSGGSVGAGQFPAKYSFDVTAASCTDDFVVYNTSADGTALAQASITGTFTAGTPSGTVAVNGTTLTASAGAAASATITLASGFCMAPGQGVDVNGTTFTTNATLGSGGSFTVASLTSLSGTSVTIGGVAYTFETALSGSTPANQVLIGGSTMTTAENLAVAINNGGTCGSTSSGVCTRNVTAANPQVSSSNTASATQTLTQLCAGNSAPTNTADGSKVTVTQGTAGSPGTNSASGLTFALNTSGSTTTPASNTVTASNIETVVNGNSTTSAVITASVSTNVVTLTANVPGTTGNSYTLSGNATSGVTVSGATFSGGTGTNTGADFAVDSNTTANATNLAAAINRSVTGVTATSSGAVVTVQANAWGLAGNSIALADSLGDFTWSGSATALAGGAGQGTVIAYNNLYSGCTGAVPGVFWQYNTAYAVDSSTADSSKVATSVMLSSDGSQVAFMESTTAVSSLVMLKWSSGAQENLNSAGASNVTPANYRNCAASCMTKIAFGDSHLDTNSPPFYDYASDIAYIGDNSGVLHKFAGLFSGIPGEAIASHTGTAPLTKNSAAVNTTAATFSSADVGAAISGTGIPSGTTIASVTSTTSATMSAEANSTEGNETITITTPWPITVSSNVLTSPVYDSTSGNIFVADSGGFLYSYKASTAALTGKTSQLAATGSKGIVDGPVVDSSANTVYVAVGQDASTNSSDSCTSTSGCNGVFQFATNFSGTGSGACTETANSATSWATGTICGKESVFGVGTASTVLYSGSFDNTYYSGDGTTGNLWSCGATGTPGPKLLNTPLSDFTGSTVDFRANNAINPLTSAAAGCSPVTEIYSGSTDYIFLSVTANGNQTVCTGACLYNFIVTSSVPSSANAGLAETGGTSGIVVDNTVSSPTGASQVYFSTLASQACTTSGGTGGCAVQASQAALQ